MKITYKCRMCGEFFSPCDGDRESCYKGLQIAIKQIKDESWDKIGTPPKLITIHRCSDGNYGMADLMGANEE